MIMLTLGDKYTELEELVATLQGRWFGEENTKMQQAATDFRTVRRASMAHNFA